MKPYFAMVTFAAFLLGISAPYQPQAEAPKPAPELKKLDYFTGTWAAEGEMRPGALGAGGRFTGTNRVEWMDGGFFLVTHSDFHGAMGQGMETSYMGYDSRQKVYTYDSFNSLGEADHAKGELQGDTWTWLSETTIGAQTVKGRLTQTVLSATAYTFKFEVSTDGTAWNAVLEGGDTKKK